MVMEKYRRRIIAWGDTWERKRLVTRVITFTNKPTSEMKAGDIKDDGQGRYLFGCPGCGSVAELDHDVIMEGDRISIVPSVECPYGCGFHEVITGWEFRRLKVQ